MIEGIRLKQLKLLFICNKIGHLIKDCRKRIASKLEVRKQQSNNIVTHNEKLYVAALSVEKGNDHIWYVY